MLVRASRIVTLGVMALSAVVISLPLVSFAAISPSVTVLSPIVKGLRTPVKIALDASGNAYVSDPRAGGVVKLDAYGNTQMTIRTSAAPGGLAVAQDGSLLVSQSTYVARYDVVSGQEVGRLSGGQLLGANGIAVDNVTGFVYVVDSRAGQIEVYSAAGNYSRSFGKGLLKTPTGIAFEKVARQLAVADTYGNKIQFFDTEGVFKKSIGSPVSTVLGAGISPMQFAAPVATVFEYSKDQLSVNRMYVVDSFQGNLQVVDPAVPAAINVLNTAANFIGTTGTTNGTLMVPSDAVFDAINNRLLVVNGFGNVTVYGVDGGVSPVPVVPVDPPPVVVTPPPALGLSATSQITNVALNTVSGTVDPGAVVSVYNRSVKVGDAVVVGNTWKLDVVLLEGANDITVTAQRLNSAKAQVATVITLDTQKPALAVSALKNNSNTATSVQNVSGTVADMTVVKVAVNGAPVSLASGAFSVPVTLSVGANVVSVVATDAAGNVSSESRTINYDDTAPVISILAPVDSVITSASTLVINGTVSKSATISVGTYPVSVDGNNWSVAVDLNDGLNTIEIVATDLAGNKSAMKRTVTLDTARPNLAVAAPAQDVAVKTPNILISGAAQDGSLATLEYSVNGAPAILVPVADGAYSFNFDFNTEGTYSVAVTAKDGAGNTSTVIRNVIFDVTPPLMTLNQSNGVMPGKLTGTVESGATVVVKDSGNEFGSVNNVNGVWTADISNSIYVPENVLVVATDAAGNSTAKGLTYSFPDGTLEMGGKPTIKDALHAIRLFVNQSVPSTLELAHYDIGPLVNGKPNPNGKIDLVDAILILRKSLGLKSW